MIWKPNVTVAVVAERDGKFLMVEENAGGRLVLNQPAGHLDEGEGLQQAAAREALEETAWHVVPESLVGIYRWQMPDNATTYLRACFAARCVDFDRTRELDTGIERAIWLSYQELLERAAQMRSPMVMRCIDDYRAGHRFPLALLHDL